MESIRKVISIVQSPAVPSIIKWSECVRKRIWLICILNAVLSSCALGITVVTKFLIDGAVAADTHALWKYGIILAAFILCEAVMGMVLAIVRTTASASLQRNLQGMLMRELLVKDYAGIKGYHSGELVNRLFSDATVVRNGIMNVLPELISTMVSFFGAAIILIILDWRFVILLIAGAVIEQGMFLLFRNPMKQRHKRKQEAEGMLHVAAQETLENIRLIKASASESRTMRQIGNRQDNLLKEQLRQGRFSAFMNSGVGLIFDLSWFFCMIWGCISISRGLLTYGSLAAMIQLIGRIQGPIAESISIASETYSLVSSAERLQELTDLPSEEEGEIITDFDSLSIENVTFQYDDGIEDVLKDINCTIKRGDFTALTGISGGGKSSLFQLLLGIYKPTQGEVFFQLGDRKIHASKGTRGLFAYVPQGNTLFSGSLKDNLIMFTDKATDEEIMEACRIACIDDLIAEIGFGAMLGERGVGLSEGQAQRVGIARALLSGAPILLLDEATSALDELTEARLLSNLSMMRDKTCIIVTHRKAALEICDYCLHIEEGRMTRETIEEAKKKRD